MYRNPFKQVNADQVDPMWARVAGRIMTIAL